MRHPFMRSVRIVEDVHQSWTVNIWILRKRARPCWRTEPSNNRAEIRRLPFLFIFLLFFFKNKGWQYRGRVEI